MLAADYNELVIMPCSIILNVIVVWSFVLAAVLELPKLISFKWNCCIYSAKPYFIITHDIVICSLFSKEYVWLSKLISVDFLYVIVYGWGHHLITSSITCVLPHSFLQWGDTVEILPLYLGLLIPNIWLKPQNNNWY